MVGAGITVAIARLGVLAVMLGGHPSYGLIGVLGFAQGLGVGAIMMPTPTLVGAT
ncbi:hypothetical protein [Flexivirga meconopsidis]|uniref:hypothetical protein n=1 Tax=Flexivirga meconopsidis TaxID=2977121 RepID=UPI00223EDF73|nr:hypothetical protein [Flexivirga meconopsidis]